MSHRVAELALTERGDGERAVVLLHGFPELAYSWRHQLEPLAAAGLHVLAPDLRGYGDSPAPAEVEAYDLEALAGDVLALLDAHGHERAAVVGHDWGAALAWHLAWTRPERVAAVAGLSVPFTPRPPVPPVPVMRRRFGEDFYIVWFQEPGVAEAALERDVRRTLTAREVWGREWAERGEAGEPAEPPPGWLGEEALAVYVETFERTGFRGGLNWYRNLDRNWELTAGMGDRRIEPPALFLTGSRDPVQLFMPAASMEGWVPDLRTVVIEGAGHWVQQQRPAEVTDALLGFLRDVGWVRG